MKTAAIYTRVSSDLQKENNTIGSQIDALHAFAQEHGFVVPKEYVIRDEGFSGGLLVRPGLEKVRDLSAEGHLQAVLVYSPDRLSRNYAHQAVLMEEFASCGVEVLFFNAPKEDTPEAKLLIQFQGMIAEYERALITERCRRGRRFKAKSGFVSVLSNAPYGYNYIKKTNEAATHYEINEQEAKIVQQIYRMYTEDLCSIAAVKKALNDQQVPTRKSKTCWERSTIWGILRNPAYIGKACYGKTERSERQRVTKPYREKGRYNSQNPCNKERPRDEWIEIQVPQIITQAAFDIAKERLKTNKAQSQRNTKLVTLLQGMMVCGECGYSLCRMNGVSRVSKKKLYYYRCLGADNYRFPTGRKCQCKAVRQDYLDNIVWENVIALLEEPTLIQKEIERRIDETKTYTPLVAQKASIEKQKIQLSQAMDKLLDAYQEGLIPLDQLRKRMPELQKRINITERELENIMTSELAMNQRLQLLDVESFTNQINQNINQLDINEKRKILKLLVKEVVVSKDCIEIKHSIPLIEGQNEKKSQGYRLCTWRYFALAGLLTIAIYLKVYLL